MHSINALVHVCGLAALDVVWLTASETEIYRLYYLMRYTAIVQTVIFNVADTTDVGKKQTHQNVQCIRHDISYRNLSTV